jgi:hypothetical protein
MVATARNETKSPERREHLLESAVYQGRVPSRIRRALAPVVTADHQDPEMR